MSGEFDGTVVSDFLTKLNDRRDDDEAMPCTSDADCVGAPDTYAINDLCGHAGHRDWRLPNMHELKSIWVDGFCTLYFFVRASKSAKVPSDLGRFWSSSRAC